MAYVGQPTAAEIDELKVEIKTAPFEIPKESDLYYEMHQEILDRSKNIMRSWKVKADFISGSGNEDRNLEACEAWTSVLTDNLQVPIKVKCIYYSPSFDTLEYKLFFGVEMTEEIFKRFNDKYAVELTDLIKDVFGD